uniref:Uncharacterized protein n=1 Tax=Octopus bimaculoides TaxID=37653 RepID=A0A0L8HZZ7_OCTBM
MEDLCNIDNPYESIKKSRTYKAKHQSDLITIFGAFLQSCIIKQLLQLLVSKN